MLHTGRILAVVLSVILGWFWNESDHFLFCICNFPRWNDFGTGLSKYTTTHLAFVHLPTLRYLWPGITKLKVSLCSIFSHLSVHSFGLSRLSAGDRAEPSEGEAHEPEDGQQVGERRGVHRRDPERGAGLLHARRPLQSPALTSLWLPRGGMTGALFTVCYFRAAHTDLGSATITAANRLISVHQQSHGERSSGVQHRSLGHLRIWNIPG